MQEYMKRLLKTSIESVVNKHYRSNPQDETEDQQQDDKQINIDTSFTSSQQHFVDSKISEASFRIEEVAIKASIEFCLAISEVNFLFNDIYRFFEEKGLS